MSGKKICKNIVELAEFILSKGNELDQKEIFESYPDGWQCRLKKPIDFSVINEDLELRANIELSPESDEVLDTSTWSSILGGNAKNKAAAIKNSV